MCRCRDSELTERHDAAPDQRLAAGEAKLAHAARDEGGAQPVELFQRQNIGLGQEGHVLGHAVDAAEIAAVGDRDAQIGDVAAERIDQRRPPGGTVELPHLCTVHRHAVCASTRPIGTRCSVSPTIKANGLQALDNQ